MKTTFALFCICFCIGLLNAATKRGEYSGKQFMIGLNNTFVYHITDHNDYSKNPMRIVCYVGTWSVYHKVDPYTIEDIDPFKCTHLMYGFAKIDEYKYTIQVFDPYQDDNHNSWEKRKYNE